MEFDVVMKKLAAIKRQRQLVETSLVSEVQKSAMLEELKRQEEALSVVPTTPVKTGK